MARPLFIVGCFRSGTTLLRLILNANSRITISDEARYIPRYINSGRKRATYNKSEVRALCEKIIRQLKRQRWAAVPDISVLLDYFPNGSLSYNEIVETINSFPHKVPSDGYWGDNTPMYIEHWEQLKDQFPDARFINMVRDPRDVIASTKSIAFNFGFSTYTAARIWEYRLRCSVAMREQLPSADYFEVRYEELVREPERIVSELCEFLGVEYEADMLRFNESIDAAALAEVQPHHKKVLQGITDKSVGAYRSGLSPRQLSLIERVTETLMVKNGYPRVTESGSLVAVHEQAIGHAITFVLQWCDKIYQLVR